MEMSISFSAHLQAQLYLPDILHIVTMLVGTGLASQRSAIYSIVINTLTCLCSLEGPNHESSALYAIIKRLGLPSVQALFGLYPNDLALRYTEDDFGFREPISSIALESIVQLLIEAVKVASPAIGKQLLSFSFFKEEKRRLIYSDLFDNIYIQIPSTAGDRDGLA
jgi:neurofibromin 1